MRVLIAGATGVIGRQAVLRVAAAGHDVIGISPQSSAEVRHLAADLLDADALASALRSAAPDAVVHLATAIPDPVNPRHIARDIARTNRLRSEGTVNLIAAAREAGAGQIIAQCLAYAYDPAGPAICSEDRPLWRGPPRQFARDVAALHELERRVLDADCTVLRLGHLYGPGSTYAADGATTAQIRRGKLPIVGAGGAIFSFIHADDAAAAIVAALERDLCGVLNIVDDDPAPLREWLPEMARMLDAPEPRHIPPWAARIAVGPFGVAFMTQLRGADDHRARRRLGWAPGHPGWREGLKAELVRPAHAA
jgi:nucleoside-diphosphate-sugar epimerase